LTLDAIRALRDELSLGLQRQLVAIALFIRKKFGIR
jgi:hypothetical protein